MARYTISPYTEEAKAILKENELRLKKIFGTHDQYSGRGIFGHVHKVTIEGYPIRVQWLTDEVYQNELYQEVISAGSVEAYVKSFNEEYGVSITEEDVINELFIARVSRDPAFAFCTIFEIKSKKEGQMVPFILNYAQLIVLEELEKMRIAGVPIRIILLKARQWGGSTLVQLYIAWVQLFVKEGWYSVIVAQTKDTAKRIKAMYKKVLDRIPGFMFGVDKLEFRPYEKSASDYIIADGSGKTVRNNVTTVASYENFESTRGQDYAMAHFSEVAYWKTTDGKSAEQVITNIDSNILEEALTIEVSESTANGMSGYFYDEYQLAKEGKSSRRAIFIPFFYIENDMLQFESARERREFAEWLVKNKDVQVAPSETEESGQYLYGLWLKGATLEHIKWYIAKRKSFHDHASMASEAPSDDVECFKFSGNRVFNLYLIETLREKYVRHYVFRGDISQSEKTKKISLVPDEENGNLRIWKHPDKLNTLNQYLVIVDVGGRSAQSDPSCITVLNRFPLIFGGKLEVVARWHGHIRYDFLAYKAVKIARYYKNAKLVFESNTFDKKKAEASEFVEQGDHIRGILKKVEDIYNNLYMRSATDHEDIRNGILTKIGYQTNKKTKQDMVDNFIVEFEDDRFIDPDDRMYKEAAIYEQRPDGNYGNIAGRGNHDDILMTDMIGAIVSSEMPMPSLVKEEHTHTQGDGYTPNESSL